MDAAVVQLSAQLTQAIALVELQRATVEESILRLFGEAQQLNQVSDALCEAATTQGTVLIHLQQLLQSSNAPSDMVQSLAPAALGIAAASGALAAPPPPPSESGPTWSVGEAGVPGQGDTVWHDGQQCTVQYVNSKGLLDLRNQGGAVFYGVAKVHLAPPPGPSPNGGSGGRGSYCGGTSESGEADSPRDSPRSDVVTDFGAFRTPANKPLGATAPTTAVAAVAPAAVAAVAPAAVAPLAVAPLAVAVPAVPPLRPPPPTRAATQVIEPEFSSDEEGIEYVKNLRISGGTGLGATLEASGEFVGTPSCQWYRVGAGGKAVAIEGAAEQSRQVTVDDIGCSLRVECIGPFGGKAVTAETPAVVQADAATKAELQKLQKKAEGTFNVHTLPANEQRVVSVDRKGVKVSLPLTLTLTPNPNPDPNKGVKVSRQRCTPPATAPAPHPQPQPSPAQVQGHEGARRPSAAAHALRGGGARAPRPVRRAPLPAAGAPAPAPALAPAPAPVPPPAPAPAPAPPPAPAPDGNPHPPPHPSGG